MGILFREFWFDPIRKLKKNTVLCIYKYLWSKWNRTFTTKPSLCGGVIGQAELAGGGWWGVGGAWAAVMTLLPVSTNRHQRSQVQRLFKDEAVSLQVLWDWTQWPHPAFSQDLHPSLHGEVAPTEKAPLVVGLLLTHQVRDLALQTKLLFSTQWFFRCHPDAVMQSNIFCHQSAHYISLILHPHSSFKEESIPRQYL